MNKNSNPEWDPQPEVMLKDQTAAYEGTWRHCPLMHSEYMNWSLFYLEDVMRALPGRRKFSSAVSCHSSRPHGMAQSQLAIYRRTVGSYLSAELIPVLAEDYALSVNAVHPSGRGAPLALWTDRPGAGHDTIASG